jgi:thiosulfate/3-mercaptopyruvate sulfurtransferase
MMPIRRRSFAPLACLAAAALIPTLALPSTAQAQSSPRSRMLVTTTWLADHVRDPDLVLLHVGDRAEYDAGHIQGARYIQLRDIALPQAEAGGLSLQLPPPGKLAPTLESLGISDDSRIVVYYGNDWVTPATRVIFTLDYMGLGDRTTLLDGGMQQWKKEGRPLTADVPAPDKGRLSARSGRDLVASLDWVKSRLDAPGARIIDARAAVFYDGVQEGSGRLGHIQGAANIPYSAVFTDDLRLADEATLRGLFTAAGVKTGDTVVTYCHIGQQATAVLFAARSLGYDVRLFDGSFEEWAQHPELPVDNPKAKTGGK